MSLIIGAYRLDKHGVGSEKLPAETGVSTLFDALNSKTPGWPHAIPLLEVCHNCFLLDIHASGSDPYFTLAAVVNCSSTSTWLLQPSKRV